MAYSVYTDIIELEIIIEELVALTDDDKTGSPDIGIINANIAKADAEIDGYIGDQYDVPLALPPPEVIKNLSATIAAYWIYRRRNEVNESIFDAYTKALAKLKAISKGLYSLTGVAKKTAPSGIASTIDSTVRQEFTKTKRDADGQPVGDNGSMDTW